MGTSKILGYQGTLGIDRILRTMCYEFWDDSSLVKGICLSLLILNIQ